MSNSYKMEILAALRLAFDDGDVETVAECRAELAEMERDNDEGLDALLAAVCVEVPEVPEDLAAVWAAEMGVMV